jgi:alpha-glucosidase
MLNGMTKSATHPTHHRWPEGAIVYQIYPRSFYDANGDGIGDIPGITQKFPYLKELGVNAVWLSPFYTSPMADFGYDVADYCDVDPIFGTLADFDAMLAAAHKHQIRVIIDLVPNHSSDEHKWFRQSRQSREDTYSDWYIWRDPKGHGKTGKPLPPNNWVNVFSGESAWEWEPARQQFYLHSFHAGQPDLNWSNPEVREAIKNVMRFWLDKGVDGFRVDAVPFMAKDPELRDDPKNPQYKHGDNPYGAVSHVNSMGWPAVHAYLNEMASVLKEPQYERSERFMVTEGYPQTADTITEYLAYYEGMDPAVAAPFNFEGLGLPWQAAPWRKFLANFHTALDAFSPLCVPSYAFGNHDQHRIVTRLGEQAARSAAVLLLTLPGMAFIYNGDEIGMRNGIIPPDFVQDPGAAGGDGRDPERTPLQWGPGKNADFTTARMPWLPVADNYETYNVASESQDPHSFLSLYQKLGALRNSSKAIKYGIFAVVDTGDAHVLGFIRKHEDEVHVVLVNFSNQARECALQPGVQLGSCLVSSRPGIKKHAHKHGYVQLAPHEASIFTAK